MPHKFKGYGAIFFCLTALSLPFVVGSMLSASTSSAKISKPEMTPELELGKAIYETYCSDCHGINAVGSDRGPTFIHKVYHPGHHGDATFLSAPKNGAKAHHWQFGDMPPIEGVTEMELLLIRDYVRALQKANGIY